MPSFVLVLRLHVLTEVQLFRQKQDMWREDSTAGQGKNTAKPPHGIVQELSLVYSLQGMLQCIFGDSQFVCWLC